MIYVIATVTIKPEKTEETLAAARIAIAETVKEKGCISYDLHTSVTNPTQHVFVERWEDRDCLNAHMHQPHFKVWRKAGAEGITARKIEIITDGKVEVM